MKAYDFEAVTYDGAVYCVQCLPKGLNDESEGVMPIFADSEWDSYPTCDHCHAIHDYVSLTTYGQAQEIIEQAIREYETDEFDGLVVADTSEVPNDYDGQVLHVNERGNCTLYSANNGNLKAIASRV